MDCPICKDASSVSLRLKKTNVFKCGKCKHRFSDTKAEISLYGQEYFSVKHKNFFENPDLALFNYIMDTIIQHKGRQCKVLDVGCGNGSLLKLLLANGFSDLCGIDLIENKYKGINFINNDFFKYQTLEKFDVILSIYNIEHIKDINNYMTKMKSLLKDDGILIITTINDASLIYLSARIFNKIGITFPCQRLYDAHHINHFSIHSLGALAKIYCSPLS
ncbi:MAG: class I SAM-dependent methyltransferase [Candidatus Omnitrophica bacterium]|nr:class I SAM-dependent methyltransferase [Candidatus Omnitrophota bacterium]MDD5430370.1 class I SAM-dependent methyltransferase [Candidatus Omnitrophota bacterium]